MRVEYGKRGELRRVMLKKEEGLWEWEIFSGSGMDVDIEGG